MMAARDLGMGYVKEQSKQGGLAHGAGERWEDLTVQSWSQMSPNRNSRKTGQEQGEKEVGPSQDPHTPPLSLCR